MAPALRSSAPSTPAGKSSTVKDTPLSTPRKVPHCTKCKRPKAGHPRSGCPFANTPVQTGKDATTSTDQEPDLTEAISSLRIVSPFADRDGATKATIRNRRRSSIKPVQQADTLLSLSSNSSELVAKLLLELGPSDEDTSEEEVNGKSKKVIHWQEALAVPIKFTPRNKIFSRPPLPGTLNTPTPVSSFGSAEGRPFKQEAPYVDDTHIHTSSGSDACSTQNLNHSTSTNHTNPIVRSMSVEEREFFVSSLTRASDATVYVVPKTDIAMVHASATKLGFHARAVLGEDDDRDMQGLLVLGRDEKAVQKLSNQVAEGDRKMTGRRSGKLRAAAGGAVVGAVGAWAGLAFS